MKRILPLSVLALSFACTSAPGPRLEEIAVAGNGFRYPNARQADLVEDFHGTAVPDPYHWMVAPDDPETRAWVAAQNALTRAHLDAIPARKAIESRLAQLWNYPRYGLPERHGDRYYYELNDGLQNQPVLYMVTDLEGDPQVVLDPNTFSEDGAEALTTQAFSPNGRLLAYGRNPGGSDWGTLHVRDIDAGRDYDEVFANMRYTGVAWKRDNSGFYYTQFPAPGSVPDEDLYFYQRVYWHRLGTAPADDPIVFSMPEEKDLSAYPMVTDDGAYLFLYLVRGTDSRNGLYYRPMDSDGDFVRLLPPEEALYEPVGAIGSVIYLQTDLDAPRGRIVALDLERPDRADWRQVIPQHEQDVISSARLINGHLVVQVMHQAHELLKIYDLQGNLVHDIQLPAMGSVEGPSGRQEDSEFFFSFTSFLYPTAIYRYDFAAGEAAIFRASTVAFDPSGYETTQAFYPSKDGTRVSLFLTHRKGLRRDGKNPALLYGYGGFNISELPEFDVRILPFIEAGGVYALANLRGGSEYGEDWHQAGMLRRKQNVFDDFIAAAEWLIGSGYTSSRRLAINGRSNGGLLTAAVLVQRPKLFGVAVPQVGVLDMLHYHQWGAGRFWTAEYGNAEADPDHFKFLYAYSPLHNVRPGTAYPPTLITTAETDDRVVPVHSKKFAAALQAADAGTNPILIRVETRAGHGAGKPIAKRIQEYADIYAFIFKHLGME